MKRILETCHEYGNRALESQSQGSFFRCQGQQQFLVSKIWLLTIAVWLPNEILVDLVLLGTAGISA
jgi:hypothetical protein